MSATRKVRRRRSSVAWRVKCRQAAHLMAAFAVCIGTVGFAPHHSPHGVREAVVTDDAESHSRWAGELSASLMLMAYARQGVRSGAGPYEYLRPRAVLPVGMSFNPWTGMLDGTVFDTTYATNLPTTEVTLADEGSRAANRSALNSAIATAAASGSGTRIILAAGADYGGSSTLPVNSSSGWIYIEDPRVKAGTLPEGSRVDAGDATLMPKFYMTARNSPVLTGQTGADRYRFVGLEFAFAPSGVTWGERATTTGNNQGGFLFANHEVAIGQPGPVVDWVIDRCFVHGEHEWNCQRGMRIDGTRVAVIDSSIDRVIGLNSMSDGQCFLGGGAGPYKFVNTYTAQGHIGENIMFGGGTVNVQTADIEVQRCHFDYPYRSLFVSSADNTYNIKNLFELKVGHRCAMQGNVFSGFYSTWTNASQYYAVLFKAERQVSSTPASIGTDQIVMLHNRWENCTGMVAISHQPNSTNPSELPINTVDIINCVSLRNTVDPSDAPRTWLAQLSLEASSITFRHNSLATAGDDSAFVFVLTEHTPLAENPMGAHQYADNVIAMTAGNTALNWWRNSTTASSAAGITGYNWAKGDATVFEGNALTRTATLPDGNTSVASTAAGGVNETTLELASDSALRGTARNGRDPGCVFALLNAATAGVV